jgi:hypothetical protein
MTQSALEEILSRLQSLPANEREEVEKAASDAVKGLKWIPTIGPQMDAYYSPADVLLYGGQGGGGKSDLGLGLAFTAHKRSLILRRQYANLSALTERSIEINATRAGYNGSPPPLLRTDDNRYIQFGANQHLGDEQNWQGHPFDYKYFDEAVQFLELQVRFHLGWLRSSDPKQRCRAVLGSNPPIDASGDWLVGMFRPWLDLTHPNPAKPGELRWFVVDPDGNDLEVGEKDLKRNDKGQPCYVIGGKTALAMSRSFIPAALKDNPYLARTDYQAKLDALPEPIRSAVRDGNFMAARRDADFQVIPTQWVIEAQARWKADGWRENLMTAMGFDPAGGGRDSAELIWRHGAWYAPPVSTQGPETADGSMAAAMIIKHRRDGAPIVIDVGGGYGGATTLRLKDNQIGHIGFNGAERAAGKTKDRQLEFANKRALAWWRFREALDPDQPGGSPLALPPDPELRADLTAPTYQVSARGLVIEGKDKLRERLGRSPGKGDAAVMAWDEGQTAIRRGLGASGGWARPQVQVGHAGKKGRRS